LIPAGPMFQSASRLFFVPLRQADSLFAEFSVPIRVNHYLQ
jgi:hypothetical protein